MKALGGSGLYLKEREMGGGWGRESQALSSTALLIAAAP